MSSSRLRRRTWIGAGIPLLAVVLTGALLFAVRSGDSAQGAPSPQPAIAAAPSAAVQKTVTLAPTSAATVADAEPRDLLPSDGLPDEIVARVAGAIITQQDLNEAIVIDAIMVGLAGQAPTHDGSGAFINGILDSIHTAMTKGELSIENISFQTNEKNRN
ncbi:MAG: hypothetical protein R6W76_21880 [Caldilinea sp.]